METEGKQVPLKQTIFVAGSLMTILSFGHKSKSKSYPHEVVASLHTLKSESKNKIVFNDLLIGKFGRFSENRRQTSSTEANHFRNRIARDNSIVPSQI